MDWERDRTAQLNSVEGADREALLGDDFSDGRRSGAVVGSACTSGHERLGCDVEQVFSIDNGALRVAPLIEPGFGRAVLAYGPFTRRAGLAFAVYMINGHNTSQAEPLSDSFRHRVNLWMRGSEIDPQWQRMGWWLWQARFRRAWRQMRWWKHSADSQQSPNRLDENLAVGWFPRPVVADPRVEGNAFIMHATGPENGELWTGGASSRAKALRGVQNLPIYYIAVARGTGTVYYVASVDGTVGLSAYPWLRPVAVDQDSLPNELYLGVQQSVLGQIGFRLDSRVYGVRVATLAGYDSWCGGSHAADRLTTQTTQAGVSAEQGGEWQIMALRPGSDVSGVAHPANLAVLEPGDATGLIHATATLADDAPVTVGLVWRCEDERNHWRLELTARACEMVAVVGGARQTLASREHRSNGVPVRLQVLDDGARVMAYLDGQPIAEKWIADTRMHDATKVGVLLDARGRGHGSIRDFEAHPRRVRIPEVLDMGAPWLRKGTQVVIEDAFDGVASDLQDRATSVGGGRWQRILGRGTIGLTGTGAARVNASVQDPCPGRTAYCVDWARHDFVDVEACITPPGQQHGEKQRTTAGFILYQDARNYVTLNAYRSDYYPAGSVSTFFKFGGFEDVYDAIWSNVADRINYGRPSRLRLCCDGERYAVFINDEIVLFRAFRDVYPEVGRLRIRKVGIIANWEFGTDTGSTFEHFRLRV